MKEVLSLLLLRPLIFLLLHYHHLCFGINFFQLEPTKNTSLLNPKSQFDCKSGSSVLSQTPCFAGDVKVKVTTNEGESAELKCFVYNVDFSKTLVSWWKDGELQEISLGLTTQDKRFRLPRQFYEDWTLIIDDAKVGDTGGYSCQINLETVLEKMFHLNVIGKREKKKVDRSFWLVKDEAYKAEKPTAHQPGVAQPSPVIPRPFVTNEMLQPLNDERYVHYPKARTTSLANCLSPPKFLHLIAPLVLQLTALLNI